MEFGLSGKFCIWTISIGSIGAEFLQPIDFQSRSCAPFSPRHMPRNYSSNESRILVARIPDSNSLVAFGWFLSFGFLWFTTRHIGRKSATWRWSSSRRRVTTWCWWSTITMVVRMSRMTIKTKFAKISDMWSRNSFWSLLENQKFRSPLTAYASWKGSNSLPQAIIPNIFVLYFWCF